MKTAVIYARYSSDSQSEQSIEGQLHECQRFAERNDIYIVDTYIDRAMTGKNDNRAAFQKMLHDSAKRQWQIVLVYKLDRFSRNKYETVIHKKTLRDNGVKLVSAMEYIPETPEGNLMESVLEGLNQYYSEELTQKVNRGLRESWAKGNTTGGKRVFGYDVVDKKCIINKREAEIVVELFERYANGEVVSSILTSFNERGILRANGTRFNTTYMYYLLHNSRYTGKVEHHGILYDKIFPRIISDSLWARVSAIYEDNKITPSRTKDANSFLLSSKLVCGACKTTMVGVSGTSMNGNKYQYYTCNNKHHKKAHCDSKPTSKIILEDIVIRRTLELLKDDKTIKTIAETIYNVHQKHLQENNVITILINKKAEIDKAIKNLVKAVEQGFFSPATTARLTELQEQGSQIDFEIDRENRRCRSSITVRQIEIFLKKYFFTDLKDFNLKRTLVKYFIREIVVYSDYTIITYNFIEPTEPIKITLETTNEIERQSKKASLFFYKNMKIVKPKNYMYDDSEFIKVFIAQDYFGIVCNK